MLTNSERTKRAMAAKQAAGLVYGPTLFGYRPEEDRLVPVPEEQALIAEAIRMDRAGSSSRGYCANDDCERSYAEAWKTWGHNSVLAIMRSKIVTERVQRS